MGYYFRVVQQLANLKIDTKFRKIFKIISSHFNFELLTALVASVS